MPLILMLHDAPNAAMRQALAKIAKLPPVKSKPVMIRVETGELSSSTMASAARFSVSGCARDEVYIETVKA